MTVQHCIDAIDKGFHTATDKKRLGTCLSKEGRTPLLRRRQQLTGRPP
jgi:hypothetical protein